MSSEKTGSSLEAMFKSSSSESEVERQMMDWAMEESSGQDVVSVAKYPEAIPQDVVPLRTVPAEVESSGTPSTSQPSNILSKNPASKVTGDYLRKMKELYKFPQSIQCRLPLSNERVDFKIPGWIALYERPFKDGLRFPIPTLVREVLNHFAIAPSQLMPNSWRILMSIEVMSYELAVEYGVRDLLYTYFMKEHWVEKGRYLLTLRQKREQLVVGLPTNDRGDWQSYYFLVRGEMVYGSSRADGIPDHWSLSSE